MMTEVDAFAWAAREGCEIEKVPGSEQMRHDVDGR